VSDVWVFVAVAVAVYLVIGVIEDVLAERKRRRRAAQIVRDGIVRAAAAKVWAKRQGGGRS
jgi:hypothetical protein